MRRHNARHRCNKQTSSTKHIKDFALYMRKETKAIFECHLAAYCRVSIADAIGDKDVVNPCAPIVVASS